MCVIFASHAPVYNGLPDWQSQMRYRQATGKERIHQEAKAKRIRNQYEFADIWYWNSDYFQGNWGTESHANSPTAKRCFNMKMKDTNEKQPEKPTSRAIRTANRKQKRMQQQPNYPNISAWNCFPSFMKFMQGKTIRCNGKSISKSIDEDLKQRMIHSKLSKIRFMRTHWCWP